MSQQQAVISSFTVGTMNDVGINLRRDRRHARLNELLEELHAAGMTDVEIARELATSRTYLAAMKKGERGVGDKLAARIEMRFGKPEGWMDRSFEEPHPLPDTSVRDALAIVAAAINKADDIARMQVAPLLAKLCEVDLTTRLRYCNAIANQLPSPGPVNLVRWENVCRETVAVLDESKGKDKIRAYLEMVDMNYQLIQKQLIERKSVTSPT